MNGERAMFDLSDDQRELQALAGKLAADRYAPNAQRWDAERVHLPEDERRRLGELGLLP